MSETVCRYDGVEVTTARNGRLVHVEEVPRGVPEHEIDITSRGLWEQKFRERADLRLAVAELVEHHVTFHPGSDCEWVERVNTALKATMA